MLDRHPRRDLVVLIDLATDAIVDVLARVRRLTQEVLVDRFLDEFLRGGINFGASPALKGVARRQRNHGADFGAAE